MAYCGLSNRVVLYIYCYDALNDMTESYSINTSLSPEKVKLKGL